MSIEEIVDDLEKYIGQSFKQQTTILNEKIILNYLSGCNTPHFLYENKGNIALPTLLSMIPYHSPLKNLPEDVILFNIGNTFKLVKPLQIGSLITTEASIINVRIRAKMIFVHLKCRYINKGQLIGFGTIIWMMDPEGVTTELIGGQIEKEQGNRSVPPNRTAFSYLSRSELLNEGELLPSFCNGRLTREQIKIYVEQTGDQNPIHVDVEFAIHTGYRDVVIPGLMKMALLEQYVIRCIGEAGRIIELKADYKRTDYAGDTLMYEGMIKSVTADDGHWYVEIELNIMTEMNELSTIGSCTILLKDS